MVKKVLLIFAAFVLLLGALRAENPEAQKEGAFNASETILHHILDNHDWEIIENPHVGLSLPWILYSSRDGLCFYANTDALKASGKFGYDAHSGVYALKSGASANEVEVHHEEPAHTDAHATTDSTAAAKEETHHAPANAATDVSILDFSITKTALQMMIIAIILILLFTNIAKAYTKNKGKAPSGAQSMFEPIIIFVRDLAKEYLGDKHEKFLPYLLTLFFFIWFSNLLGLTPLNSNIAGNFTVTCALALLSFILINVNGTKDYWGHIFAMPGVPKPMLLILTPIEILSLFIKPAALAIRLFANIVAGHFMVLALICLVFILGKSGESVGGSIGGIGMGVTFAVIIFCLEMLVAIIQAYIFTLLTTVFLSMAMESHDEHGHGHDKHPLQDLHNKSEVNKELGLGDFGTH